MKVTEFKLLPSDIPEIVEAANFVIAIEADALISVSDIVPSRIIVPVTVPVSPVVIIVPVVAGRVIVLVPAVAAGCRVIVPEVDPGIATLLIPVKSKFAEALFKATDVVPILRDEFPSTPLGTVPVRLSAVNDVNEEPDPENEVAVNNPVDGLNVNLVDETFSVVNEPEVNEVNVRYLVAFVVVSSDTVILPEPALLQEVPVPVEVNTCPLVPEAPDESYNTPVD